MEPEKTPEKDSFYGRALSRREVTDLMKLELDQGLDDEIAAVRVAIRRTLLRMEEEMDTAEFLKLVDRVHKGAATIATLLRTRRAISDQAAEGILNSMVTIIQELSTENGWKL